MRSRLARPTDRLWSDIVEGSMHEWSRELQGPGENVLQRAWFRVQSIEMDHVKARLNIPALAELCRAYGVTRLAVFGSVLGNDFSAKSDLDFVVDFGVDADRSAAEQFFGFAEALEQLVGRRVDLVERRGIRNPYFRETIERQEVSVFAA